MIKQTLIALAMVSPTLAAAQAPAPKDTLTIDLAMGNVSRPVKPGFYEIMLHNAVPWKHGYNITYDVRNLVVSALEIPKNSKEPLFVEGKDECAAVDAAVHQLEQADENTLQSARDAFESALPADTTKCKPGRATGKSYLMQSNYPGGAFQLAEGQELVVTITNKAETTQKWVATFSTGERGHWVTSYGYSAIAKVFFPDQRYFLQKKDSDHYAITRETNDKKFANQLGYAPIILFTWQSSAAELGDWQKSWSAGINLDVTHPTVLGGYTRTYNQNIGFTAGLAMHFGQRLAGRFYEGQLVTDNNITLNDTRFAIDPFVAISIRSLTNPFAPPAGSDAPKQ